MIAGVGIRALDPLDLGVLDPTGLLMPCFSVILNNYCKIRLFAGVFNFNREEIEKFRLRMASFRLLAQLCLSEDVKLE